MHGLRYSSKRPNSRRTAQGMVSILAKQCNDEVGRFGRTPLRARTISSPYFVAAHWSRITTLRSPRRVSERNSRERNRAYLFRGSLIKQRLQLLTRIFGAHKGLADQEGIDPMVPHQLYILRSVDPTLGYHNGLLRNRFQQIQRGL